MKDINELSDKFEGCILGGAIGDAWGSSYENEQKTHATTTYYLRQEPEKQRSWQITDDTQLTLATCEALCEAVYTPQKLSEYFVKYYRTGKLRGIGASTLKAISELAIGQHWSQAGRRGEYAAGNGAAMRIAPFAFFKKISRDDIRDASKITHANDEAYCGALAVYLSLKNIIETGRLEKKLITDTLTDHLPDCNVRDRIIEIDKRPQEVSIADLAMLGNNGYVVNSVPFAIYSALKVKDFGMDKMLQEVIDAGGDTDTNASIAGQIAGTFMGSQNIPGNLKQKLAQLPEYRWMENILSKVKSKVDNF
ncbi:MAG: ADP-ribosylglycohydrolase family protein [Agriterribacter sp.]